MFDKWFLIDALIAFTFIFILAVFIFTFKTYRSK
jgi:hypothetical protein